MIRAIFCNDCYQFFYFCFQRIKSDIQTNFQHLSLIITYDFVSNSAWIFHFVFFFNTLKILQNFFGLQVFHNVCICCARARKSPQRSLSVDNIIF